jgi:predicted KAP-like P-loop ATPase
MWADNETDKDLLCFKVHADLIKSVISDKNILPVSIGVFGDWGSGKTSIMKILEKELESEKDIVCLYFNGWTFEGYDDAKAALIEDILLKLKENRKIGVKITDEVNHLLDKVNWLRAGGFLLKNVAKPALMAYATGGASLLVDGLSIAKDFFSDVVGNGAELIKKAESPEGSKIVSDLKEIIKESPEKQIPAAVRDFRKDFAELIEKTKIDCLVILIDDLDRCNPEIIIENLEAIKLFLNVPRTAFVIGADERIVRHAIEYRYKSNLAVSSEIGKYENIVTDYLEKIIQIPYRLPKLSNSDVESYMTLLFCQKELNDKFDDIVNNYNDFRKNDKHSKYSYEQVSQLISVCL